MRTYLFDFDGTLVDSMPTFISVMLHILDTHSILYEKDIVKTITPLGYHDTARYFVELGVPMTESEVLSAMYHHAVSAYEKHIPAKNNVVSVLHELRLQGHSLNVLTASPHIMLDPCLKRLGIFDCFDNVWSCDDFMTNKSDPWIYKMAADRLGEPIDHILFLDDNYHANKTAKTAGLVVCGVYDESSKNYVDDIKQIADYYIYDFSELLDLKVTVTAR